MATIFTKIMTGEIPGYIIDQNNDFIALLDIRPIRAGHTLIIPKIELDYIFDHQDDLLAKMLPYAKKIGKHIESKISCKRIGIMVAGLEVPHTHIHLIPMESIHDLNFANAKELSQEELAKLYESLKID